MRIVNHRLDNVPFISAKVIGDTINPQFLVMHYTAGYNAKSAISTFQNTEIAAHLIVERDGTVTQMVPFNKKANHTGPSAWQGVKFLNNCAIGIEFVNIGWAKMRADGKLVDAYNHVVSDEDAKTYIEAPNARVGTGRIFWQPYTKEQIEVGLEITKAILANYQIRDIVSHEEIDTRNWKTDPGPAFPMNLFASLMRGTTTVNNEAPMAGMQGTVKTATLNIRGGAGTTFPVIGKVVSGERVNILETRAGWFRISTSLKNDAGVPVPGSGWVSSDFVEVK